MPKANNFFREKNVHKVNIPGIVLAGGQSTRMGGIDKGLISLGRYTLLEHVIARLKPQVSTIVLNANGDKSRFAGFSIPIFSDSIQGFLGPLAGVLAGFEWAEQNGYEKIVTVAADTPFFPKTLVERLDTELNEKSADIALACTSKGSGTKLTRHPTFGLWSVSLKEDLKKSLLAGTRKIVLWTEKQKTVEVIFDETDSETFYNINTQDDLLTMKEKLQRIST